jgi:thiol-disulfide isomerase/thioredoxin
MHVVRAPELVGRGGWINTGGQPYSLSDFRGRFLLLDFWTYCCINCLHVLDELRPVETEFADALVVVGVHSPKFVHEAEHASVLAAVERYGVEHPVLDDPDLVTWNAYAIKAWPTLVLIDPTGRIVWTGSGEGHAHALTALLRELVPRAEADGTLRRSAGPFVASETDATMLRFPAKAVRTDNGLLVADAGQHSVAVLNDDDVVRRYGTGERGHADGPSSAARFNEPNGLCLLPPEVTARVGYDVVIADTVNHRLRGVALEAGVVTTIAGDGRQWMQGDPVTSLSSPWDVEWWQDRVWIAMAGIHQLWTFDPLTGIVEVAAGTTNEGLRDGPANEAWLAQPSGLAADGDRLWFADSETSALRFIQSTANGYRVETAIGRGLFDFGHRDGNAPEALLQHPLGVAVLADKRVAIADTYNGSIRVYDPDSGQVRTVVTGLAEPSGLVVDGDRLLAVESAAHRLVEVALVEGELMGREAHRTQRPTTDVSSVLELDVVFSPPPGQKLDERYGPSSRLNITATPPQLLIGGEGRSTDLRRTLRLDSAVGDGVLHIAATAASCEDGENAVCHIHQQDWGIPVRITPEGTTRLQIPLSG